MFEVLIIALFAGLFVWGIRLICRVAWGLAKLTAGVLLALALPALVGYLTLSGGIMLLVPIGLLSMATGILKACI